jgi:hypothetical protein
MAWDESQRVRLHVAQRLCPDKLIAMVNDSDWCVRYVVASRIALEYLDPLTEDPVEEVREIALRRRAGLVVQEDLP